METIRPSGFLMPIKNGRIYFFTFHNNNCYNSMHIILYYNLR